MNYWIHRCRSLVVVGVLLGALGSARADSTVALDYQSKVKGCPTSERFADEVSAKLGFVPWDGQAATAIRVRIASDSAELMGTIEQPDGTTRVLRAPTCAQLDEALVSAVTVALDRPAAPAVPVPPADERRLKRLEREPAAQDGAVTVQFRAQDGRSLEISRVLATSELTAPDGEKVKGMSWEKICTAPCSAQLQPGNLTLRVRDPESKHPAIVDASVRVNSTLDLSYTSRADARASRKRRTVWGAVIGFAIGTVAGYLAAEGLSSLDDEGDPALGIPPSYHDKTDSLILGASLGLTTGFIGAWIGYATGSTPNDDARVTVRPGLSLPVASF